MDKNIIENENLHAFIHWSDNGIYDELVNGTILVNELATLIFVCKSNTYRLVTKLPPPPTVGI